MDDPDVYYSGYGANVTTGIGFTAPADKRVSSIEYQYHVHPDDYHIYDCAPDLPPPKELRPQRPPPPPPLSIESSYSSACEIAETDPVLPPHHGRKVVMKAEAEFDYDAEQGDEISFGEGDIILVLNKQVYDGWALGEIGGKKGVFPNNFVRFYEEEEEAKPKPKPSPKPTRARGATEAAPSGPPTGPPSGPPSGPPLVPPSGPPTSKPPTSSPAVQEEDHSERPRSVAAKATFLRGELQKSGADAGGSRSLPRKMNPALMKQIAADDIKSKTLSPGFTADELRRFALEHKDEFKPSKRTGPNQKRTPAPPDTVISPADVRTKISSSRRRDSEATRPEISSTEVSDPVPPTIGPPPKRMSMPPAVEPPKPSSGPLPKRMSMPPAIEPSTSPNVGKKPLPAIPVAKPPPFDQSDASVSETSDMYMQMSLDSDVAGLKNRIDVLEEAKDELEKSVSELHDNQSAVAECGASSVSADEIAAILARLEAAETVNAKTNKLLSLLQSDLDEEINTRKQLETEVGRLRRTVQVLQE